MTTKLIIARTIVYICELATETILTHLTTLSNTAEGEIIIEEITAIRDALKFIQTSFNDVKLKLPLEGE